MQQRPKPLAHLVILLLLLASCGDGPREAISTQPRSTTIQLQSPGANSPQRSLRYKGTYNDVRAIQLQIYDNASSLVDNLSLAYSAGIWSGTSLRLLQGDTYTFVGSAYSDNTTFDNTTKIFSGQTITSPDNATFVLNLRLRPIPVEGFANLPIPRIVSITRPTSIVPSENGTVSVRIEANSGDNITYDFRMVNGGLFTPDNGSFSMLASSSDLESEFTASYSIGNFTQSILVENQARMGVEAVFSILLQDQLATEAQIVYSPVILEVGAELYDNGSLGWEALVTDDNVSELEADWEFTQGSNTQQLVNTQGSTAGDNVTFNGIFSGYNPSENGTLKLSIHSPSGDNTTLTYPVDANEFSTYRITQGAYAEQITAGDNHTCALKNGNLRCWGDNNSGRLAFPSLTRATQVSAGAAHNCALDNESNAACWGDNSSGQLALPQTSNVRQVIAGGMSSCVLTTGYQSQCAGDNSSNKLPPNGTGQLAQLSIGNQHSCAVKLGGDVQCWGDNATLTNTAVDNATQVAVGSLHSCAILQNGSVTCWGDNSTGQLGSSLMSFSFPAVQLSAGDQHTCARLENETIRCWGDRSDGKIGNGTTSGIESTPTLPGGGLSNLLFVATGAHHSCGLTRGGTVFCWGQNALGQLGDGTTDNRSLPVQASDY